MTITNKLLLSSMIVILYSAGFTPAPAQSQTTTRTLYVDATRGQDKNPGTEARPFASIQAAGDATRPGDTVLIHSGLYLQTSDQAVLSITHSGAPGAMITYRPYPGDHPILTASAAWNHILITASWIHIEGIEIAGNLQNVSLADAEKVEARFEAGHKSTGPETSFAQTNGIFIRPANPSLPLARQTFPTHIEIIGNNLRDLPGGGISSSHADYLRIEGNQIRNVSARTMYATSGISILGSQNTDQADPPYRMFIENNLVVNSRTYVKWIAVKHLSDGNGIILDSNRNTGEHDPENKGEPYRGRYLVANNVVLDSGGAGIQVYASDNADVVFNTVLNNSLTPGLEYGQIWAHAASNLRIENNILVAGPGAKINQLFADNKNVVYDYNLYFGGRKAEMQGPHDLTANPEFTGLGEGDLRPQPTSPAIHSGVSGFPVTHDFDGTPRPLISPPSRGAFEDRQPR